MIITTTSSIEGQRVVKYLGPVSVHLVAGTNLFSDFIASISDIFGGASGTYGRQLTRLYSQASVLLEAEARRRSANAVVGLSIDFDELSAQGKSMFMLNAVGTAVRVISTVPGGEPDSSTLDADSVQRALRRRRTVQQLKSGDFDLTEELWEFATAERIEEFAAAAVRAVARADESPAARAAEVEKARLYFNALGPEAAARSVFSHLWPGPERVRGERDAAVSLVRKLNLMDYAVLLPMLSDTDREVARMGLLVATASRQEYSAADIDGIDAVVKAVRNTFTPRWVETTRKGMFGKEHPAWQCPCGGQPAAEHTHCPACGRDTFGLAPRDPRPEQVVDHLGAVSEVLKSALPPAPLSPATTQR